MYHRISLTPEPFRYLSFLSPTTYTARLVHGLAGFEEVTAQTILLDIAVVLSLTAVFLYIEVRKSRWRGK